MPKEWTESELKSSVFAYMLMLDAEESGETYVKKGYLEVLEVLHERPAGAFEFRMRNISAVLNEEGRDWIAGYKPAANVGTAMRSRIMALVDEFEARRPTKKKMRSLRQRFAWPFPIEGNDEWLGWLNPGSVSADVIRVGLVNEGTAAAAWPFPVERSGRLKAPPGVDQPVATQQTVTVYQRDESVRQWVLARACGKCECCGDDAPFLNTEREPFLEVHHLKQLASGGSDTVTNTAALCPNCHRHLHYGHDAETLLMRLFGLVPELRRE
jgi:5-methylcytosine-specific restriction enzyme A